MKYTNFIEMNENYFPMEKQPVGGRLPPGVYEVNYNEKTGQVYFTRSKFSHDALLDLPSKEFSHVLGEIRHFLKPETKKLFEQFGYIYKRSTLLHGVPGTGKTCIANRISQHVADMGGVVLFNPNPQLLPKAFEILDGIQPDVTTLVILEELDTLLQKYRETNFLSLLDGEIQKDNVIYVATTNFIDKIPARIRRPGRFSTVVEVAFPKAEAREFYLRHKGVPEGDVNRLTQLTDGLSIDELKEVVLARYCLGQEEEEVLNRVFEGKKRNKVTPVGLDEVDQANNLKLMLEAKRLQDQIRAEMQSNINDYDEDETLNKAAQALPGWE